MKNNVKTAAEQSQSYRQQKDLLKNTIRNLETSKNNWIHRIVLGLAAFAVCSIMAFGTNPSSGPQAENEIYKPVKQEVAGVLTEITKEPIINKPLLVGLD